MPIPFWVGRYIGLPFKEQGRNRQGVDCWGLVRLIYAENFLVSLPSYTHAYPNTNASEILGALVNREAKKWHAVEQGQEELGDVVVLRMRGCPMHVGLLYHRINKRPLSQQVLQLQV